MKVLISYEIEVDDDYRHAINCRYGRTGKASSKQVASWFKSYGTTEDEYILFIFNGHVQRFTKRGA